MRSHNSRIDAGTTIKFYNHIRQAWWLVAVWLMADGRLIICTAASARLAFILSLFAGLDELNGMPHTFHLMKFYIPFDLHPEATNL